MDYYPGRNIGFLLTRPLPVCSRCHLSGRLFVVSLIEQLFLVHWIVTIEPLLLVHWIVTMSFLKSLNSSIISEDIVLRLFVSSITLTIGKVILPADGVSFLNTKKELKLVYFYSNNKSVQCCCQLVS